MEAPAGAHDVQLFAGLLPDTDLPIMRSPLGMLGTGRATLAAGQTCPRLPIQRGNRLLRFFGLDPPPPVCAHGQDVPERKPVLGGDGLVSRDCVQSGLPHGVPAIADLIAAPCRRVAV